MSLSRTIDHLKAQFRRLRRRSRSATQVSAEENDVVDHDNHDLPSYDQVSNEGTLQLGLEASPTETGWNILKRVQYV